MRALSIRQPYAEQISPKGVGESAICDGASPGNQDHRVPPPELATPRRVCDTPARRGGASRCGDGPTIPWWARVRPLQPLSQKIAAVPACSLAPPANRH